MSLPPNHVTEAAPALELSDEQYAILAKMADWFIGPVEGFPSTEEADPENAVLHLALEQLRPLHDELVAAINAANGVDIDHYLADLEDRGAPEFEYLRTLLVGRYLSCRPVWKVLGYTGRRPIPIRQGEADEYLSGGLLDAPIARGKIYRPTPTEAAVR